MLRKNNLKTNIMFKSSNTWSFILAFVVATILMFYPGLDGGVVKQLGASLIGVYSAGNILFKFFNGKPERKSSKEVLKSKSFLLQASTFISGIFPFIPLESLQSLVDASLTGNFQLILIQVFSLVGVVYKYFKSNSNASI